MNQLKTILATLASVAIGLCILDVLGVVDIFGLPNLSDQSKQKPVVEETVVVETGTTECGSGMIPTLNESGSTVCTTSEPIKNADCIDPSGKTLKHGSGLTLYQPLIGTCTVLELTCDNGSLPLDPKGFYETTCQPIQTGGTDCTMNWIDGTSSTIYDGKYVLAYSQDFVNKDKDCEFEKIQCIGGTISSKFGFKNKTCQISNEFSPEFIKKNPDIVGSGGIIKAEYKVDQSAPGDVGCTTPWGASVQPGENVYAFKYQTVPFENKCIYEGRVCRDGKLDGAYNFKECEILGARSCTFNGKDIPHGGFVNAFDNILNGGINGNCPAEIRRCYDGTLNGTYTNIECKKTLPKASNGPARCPNPFGGLALSHGQSITAFKSSTVGFNQTCESEKRICNYGTLNGTYTFKSCAVGAVRDCKAPWGDIVKHGSSVAAFKVSSVGFGVECSSPGYSEIRTCNDGTLAGSFQYKSCTSGKPADCVSPRGTVVVHGSSITAFRARTLPYSQVCSANGNQESRTCNNGNLGGSFQFQACGVESPRDCEGTAYGTLRHGQTIARYRDPQVIGQVADGADQCVRYTATCTNGNFAGTLLSHPEATHTQCTTIIPNNGNS